MVSTVWCIGLYVWAYVVWHINCNCRTYVVCSGYKSPGSTSGPGFDSSWERISQDLTSFVLSVVDDVPVDSETPVVTSSILRICRHSLRRCS
jgi:hypothetical protein